jgi:hypothetical protein
MAGGMTMQAQTYGEFYSFTGWEYPSTEGKRCLAHYTEHGKKVELPYVYDGTPGIMSIGTLIDDATPGVLYNRDWDPNRLFRSTDYGCTWELIDTLSDFSDEYWTFKNAPGVLLKRSMIPEEMKISYDYGSHFETLDIPAFYMYNVAGWDVGEFFKEDFSDELSSWYLTHSMDFNQTADTILYSGSDYFEMTAGANEGELYTYYRSFYETIPMSKYTLYYSSDYGLHNQMLMTVDSLDDGFIATNMYWEFVADDEPGVFYSIIRDAAFWNPVTGADSKIWIDYYRDYGETLVTTYFHHFTAVPDWFDHHTPVMDCEITSYDPNSVALRWNEPELKPNEVLVGYQVYRGDNLVSEDLITETSFTDNYFSGGRLNYHVLAVYSDGEISKSYNIVYCEKTESVNENGGGTVVTVYPNPAKDKITIDGIHSAEVKVYNALGQLVKTMRNVNEISVVDLPQGVYLLRIMDAEGNVYTNKIMIGQT